MNPAQLCLAAVLRLRNTINRSFLGPLLAHQNKKATRGWLILLITNAFFGGRCRVRTCDPCRVNDEKRNFAGPSGTPFAYETCLSKSHGVQWCLAHFWPTLSQLFWPTLAHHPEVGIMARIDTWAAAASVDTDLSSLSFRELCGTEIAERRMPAPRAVEALDVVEHI